MTTAIAQKPAHQTELDSLTKFYTAFSDFADMLNAKGGYRPSFYVRAQSRPHDIVALADAYDAAQAARGDARRAYRGDFK